MKCSWFKVRHLKMLILTKFLSILTKNSWLTFRLLTCNLPNYFSSELQYCKTWNMTYSMHNEQFGAFLFSTVVSTSCVSWCILLMLRNQTARCHLELDMKGIKFMHFCPKIKPWWRTTLWKGYRAILLIVFCVEKLQLAQNRPCFQLQCHANISLL